MYLTYGSHKFLLVQLSRKQTGNWHCPLLVMFGFLFGQLVDNFFSQPVIFSKSVKSHPLEIFLVILIAGVLFGVIGLIVAIPAYTALKVILKEFLSNNKIVDQLTKNL